jgi:hypothetical protein
MFLNVSVSSYELRDAQPANATAVGPRPNRFLVSGRRHGRLSVRVANGW